MLRPYTRKVSPRPPCALDRWTGPGWTLLERHAIDVGVAPGAALEALLQLQLRELPVVLALFRLRGIRFTPKMTLREFFSTAPFVPLDEEPGREWVAGVLIGATPTSAGEFRRALAAAPMAAIATFRADPAEHGAAHLWTETWSRTRGTGAAPGFRPHLPPLRPS